MFTLVLYGAASIFLFLSWRKSREKTRAALRKAWKSCVGVLPLFFAILLCMGFLLAFVDESVIRQAVGKESGMLGIALSGLLGSVTLIPAFAAYPAAAELLRVTGGYAQITVTEYIDGTTSSVGGWTRYPYMYLYDLNAYDIRTTVFEEHDPFE